MLIPLLVAVAVAAAITLFAGNWISLVEKAFALLGAIMLTRPYFRENRFRRILDVLAKVNPGTGGAETVIEGSKREANRGLEDFRPVDYRDSCIGIGLLILSFVLGTLAELIKLTGTSVSP